MNSSLSTISSTITHLGLGRPTVAEWALLVLLGGSLLALRTFHARYFKAWVLGWVALVVSRLAGFIDDLALIEDLHPKLGLAELQRARLSCSLVEQELVREE